VTRPGLQSFHGLWRIWFDLGATQQYYPLLHTAFWLEHRVWGGAVLGYHLANIALHALSACLVVMIARRLSLPGAWLAGFIFALHPVCVEAVAWISEQKSTLSGFFYLAAVLTYLHFDRTRRRSQYFIALGLFVLALMSKSVTATLPAALLVVFWWQRGSFAWNFSVWAPTPTGIGYSGGTYLNPVTGAIGSRQNYPSYEPDPGSDLYLVQLPQIRSGWQDIGTNRFVQNAQNPLVTNCGTTPIIHANGATWGNQCEVVAPSFTRGNMPNNFFIAAAFMTPGHNDFGDSTEGGPSQIHISFRVKF
jgi:hypothetical protein